MGKFVLVVVVFAGLVYGCLWLVELRRTGGQGFGRPRTPERRAYGPDDDEDFLRELERRGRAGGDQRNGSGDGGGTDPKDPSGS